MPEAWTIRDLRSLLYTSSWRYVAKRSENEAMAQLVDFINLGFVNTDQLPYSITPAPKVENELSTEQRAYLKAFMGSSDKHEHAHLKWLAWNWLRTRGEQNPQFEQPPAFGWGRVDVVAPSIRYLAECGNVQASKILRCLEADLCDVFAVFPRPEGRGHWVITLTPTSAGKQRLAEQQRRRYAWIDEL